MMKWAECKMIKEEIIESIDNISNIVMESGITIDDTILHLYDKCNMLIQESDINNIEVDDIYQETFYMEAKKTETNIFVRAFNALKDLIRRFIAFMKKSFNNIFGKTKKKNAGNIVSRLIDDNKKRGTNSVLDKVASAYGVSLIVVGGTLTGTAIRYRYFTNEYGYPVSFSEAKQKIKQDLKSITVDKFSKKSPISVAEDSYDKQDVAVKTKRFEHEVTIIADSPDKVSIKTNYDFAAVSSTINKINKCLKQKTKLCEKYKVIEMTDKKRQELSKYNDDIKKYHYDFLNILYTDKPTHYEYDEKVFKHMIDSITECEKMLTALSNNKEYMKLTKNDKNIYNEEVSINKTIMNIIRTCYTNTTTIEKLVSKTFDDKWDAIIRYDEQIINKLKEMLKKNELSTSVDGNSTIKAYPFLRVPTTKNGSIYDRVYKYPGISENYPEHEKIFSSMFDEDFSLTYAHYNSKEKHCPFIIPLGRGYIVIGYEINVFKAAKENNMKLDTFEKNGKTITKYLTDNNGKPMNSPCGFVIKYDDIVSNGIPQINIKMCFDVYMKYQKNHWDNDKPSLIDAPNMTLKSIKNENK